MKSFHPFWLAGAALLIPLSFLPNDSAAADTRANPAPPATPGSTVSEEAPQVETFSNEKETILNGDPSGNQFSGFLGAGLGLSLLSAEQEASKSGFLFEGRASVSMFTQKAIFDLGLTWLYSSVSGTTPNTLTGVNTTTQIVTQAGTLDFSPRYRFGPRFAAGPMLKILYGTDTSFSELDQASTAQVLVGAKAAWEFLDKDVQYRFGGQILTDLTIQNRQVWLPMIFFELGIPFSRGRTILRERETTRVETHRIKEIVREGSSFTFSEDVVHFEFSSSELAPDSKEFFTQVAKWLEQNPSSYTHIKIAGHTDNIGSPEINQRLSEERARAVAQALTAGGVPNDRVESVGLGLSQPIDANDTEVGRARNRRVEVNFGEGADAKQLNDAMNKIKLRTMRPRTCEGDKCR